jgi:hypothetical protein
MRNRTTNLVSSVPGGTIVDLRSEELNLEITSRQRPDRRGFIGGSGGHLIGSTDQPGVIRLCRKSMVRWRRKATERVREFGSRPQDGKAPPRGSIQSARWFVGSSSFFFLNPCSCSRSPDQRGFIRAHDDPCVRSADESATVQSNFFSPLRIQGFPPSRDFRDSFTT